MTKKLSLPQARQRITELEEQLVRLQQQPVAERLREAEVKLNESLQTLATITETLPSPLFYKNAEGVYTGCNQAFCDYLGKSREQLIGHTVYDIAPAELADVYHRADLELMQQHGTQTYQAQVRYADGSDRDILFNKATIGDPDAEVLGLVGVMIDITEIRRSELEMRNLRNLLRNIIDSMPSALITIDNQGRVSHWNQRAEMLAGLPADEAIGRDIHQLLPLLSSDLALIDQALISRKTRKISKVLRESQGVKQFFDVVIYPLVADDVSGAVIRIDDVSERVQMEKLLVQSEKMMSLGGLAAGMAHEINNPLAGILQNMQLIRSRLLSESPADQQLAAELGVDLEKMRQFHLQRNIPEMLDRIAEAGQRAAKIVQNMLSFSRKESTELLPCDLKLIIEQTLELAGKDLDGSYDFRAIRIITELADNLPPVLGVKSQLQQVLLNLLRNSAQAIYSWCELSAGPEIRISATTDNRRVTIRIADNGPGIDEKLRNRIFEPFFTTKELSSGTGLGLSVSYYIITDTHKGSLTVNSAPGEGARFNISLPICPTQPMYTI